MLSQNEIESALTRLESLGAIRLSKVGGDYYQMYCPFHSEGKERKPSFGVLLREQYRNGQLTNSGFSHCFACGYAHDFTRFITDVCKDHNILPNQYSELNRIINSKDFNQELDSLIPDDMFSNIMNKYAAESLRARVKPETSKFVTEEELASYRFTVPYMYERRLTDEVIERYDVGFDANHIPPGRSKPLPCVTFPVRDAYGHTLFFCRRSVEGKYFNYPQGVEKPVYGIYELPSNCTEVIICESVFNALTCVVYGKNAVALLGTGNPKQIEQLKRLGVKSYVICLDNDEAGHRGAEKLKKALQTSGFIWTMSVPEGKDVNDLEYNEFMECYNNKQ